MTFENFYFSKIFQKDFLMSKIFFKNIEKFLKIHYNLKKEIKCV